VWPPEARNQLSTAFDTLALINSAVVVEIIRAAARAYKHRHTKVCNKLSPIDWSLASPKECTSFMLLRPSSKHRVNMLLPRHIRQNNSAAAFKAI